MTIKLTGSRGLRADPETVWAALNDAGCLKLCIPGCLDLWQESPLRYALTVAVALGPVRLSFKGRVEVTQSVRPSVLVLEGRGQGGLAGLAVGTARLTLMGTPTGMRLGYDVEAESRGPLASLGALFLAGVAKSLTESFVTMLGTLCEDGRRFGDESRAATAI